MLPAGTPLPLGSLELQKHPVTGAVKTLENAFPAVANTTGIRDYISTILPNALIIASLILLALILVGGVGLIATAGNAEAQQKNKDVVTNAALGFGLVIGAYWLIQIIQVVTGVSILK